MSKDRERFIKILNDEIKRLEKKMTNNQNETKVLKATQNHIEKDQVEELAEIKKRHKREILEMRTKQQQVVNEIKEIDEEIRCKKALIVDLSNEVEDVTGAPLEDILESE